MTSAVRGQPGDPAGGQPAAGGVLAQRGHERRRSPARPAAAAGSTTSTSASTVVEVGGDRRPASPRARAAAGCPARPGSPRPRGRRRRAPPSGPPGCGGRRRRWRPAAPRSTTPTRPGRPRPLGQHLADGVAVEQGLGRVLVPAVAGVDHPGPSTQRATWRAAPDDGWRTTTASTPMASTVSTVSRSDSPFLTDEVATEKRQRRRPTGAWPRSRSDSRVRVDSSKNRVTTVLPRRAGTLGMARRSTSTKASATRRISSIPSAPRSAIGQSRSGRGHSGRAHERPDATTPSSLTSTISSRRVGRFLPT